MTTSVVATAMFAHRFKRLVRKYRRLQLDLAALIAHLENGPNSGQRLQGCVGLVYKIRMASRDMQRGKSGGFRVIYFFDAGRKIVYLLTLYPKNEQADISVAEINHVLKETGLT